MCFSAFLKCESLNIYQRKIFWAEVVDKNEKHLLCPVHFLRRCSFQYNLTVGVLYVHFQTAISSGLLNTVAFKGGRKSLLNLDCIEINLFYSFNVVLYWSTAVKHILNSLYIYLIFLVCVIKEKRGIESKPTYFPITSPVRKALGM
jgi:hypothetical protein